MKQIKYPSELLLASWQKNYRRDVMKFINTTHLKLDDLMSDFCDEDGEMWKILGVIETKDVACQKISTGEVFIWDRWKVSLLKEPDEHKRTSKNVVYSFSKEKKQRIKNDDELDLFSEIEE